MKRMLFACVLLLIANAASAQTGTWEIWQSPATMPASPQDLADNPWLLGNPTATLSVVNFDAPQNIAGAFVARTLAKLVILQTGNYLFWDASNGVSMTWCGTDLNFAGKVPIAKMTNAVPVSHNQWTRYAEQKSAPIALVAGQNFYCMQIYLDVTVESPTNLNHASVKWQLPDLTQAGPIPGVSLQPAPSLPPVFTLDNGGITSAGTVATNTINANLVTGPTQPLTFSVQSGLPTGMTSSFSVPSCNPTCASVLTLTTALTTPVGTYTIVVAGTIQFVTQTTSFTITVTAPTAPIPTITANPTVINLGQSTTLTENPGPNSLTCTLSASPTNANWTGSASVSAITTRSIAPIATTTFSVTCSNASGTTPANVLVTVNSTTVTATWDPVTLNTDGSPATDLTGYKLYWGTAPGVYPNVQQIGNVTQVVVTGFTPNATYYFAVTAYNPSGESARSTEVPHIM